MIEDFYPTPAELVYKMLDGIKFDEVSSILEPSAGKGDICDVLKSRLESTYNRRSNIIDVIEINPDLQATLRGKGYNLIQDDFLTFNTSRPYDLIVANFPFSNGEDHLARALALIERNGGRLVCLVNAETIRNPITNQRQMLRHRLANLEAQIEYLENEFRTAERPTGVEVALIRVRSERQAVVPLILDELKRAEEKERSAVDNDKIIEKDYIAAMVARFEFECKIGTRLIDEYFALRPFIQNSIPKKGESDKYSSPLIEVTVKGESDYGDANYRIRQYLPLVREKYWSVLIHDPRYTGQLTENVLRDLREKLSQLRNCDFNRFNIEQLGKDLALRINKGVEKAILDLFDLFSRGHAWHEQQDNGNIHYYNGWKTNKAWKVNKKVIIPMHGFSAWTKTLDYRCHEQLRDMVKVFNYLAADKAPPHLLEGRYGDEIHAGDLTNFRYFETKIYKKGTCHITFKDQELLDKFNIFGSQRKGWLPPGYGKKSFDEMDEEERIVIETFQGREAYAEVVKSPDKYIVEDAAGLLGTGGL